MLTGGRCAVVGHPVAHSLSPTMHRAAYAALGLDWTYEAVDVAEGGLAALVASLSSSWRGLSVTAPLKREAAALADTTTEGVRAVGAANTLVLEAGAVSAHDTDVDGAAAALAERGVAPRSVRVLGGGATAASVAVAAARAGARTLDVVVRDPRRAAQTVDVARAAGLEVVVRSMDAPLLDPVDLLVSTLPADAVRTNRRALVDSAAAVFDVVYDPWPSELLEAAAEAGKPVVTGLDLLAHQAVRQLELMTGRTVGVEVLRDAALAAL